MLNIYIVKSIGLICLMLFTNIMVAQCSIDEFSVSTSDCVGDNTVDLVVDMTSSDPSSIGYQVFYTTGFKVVQYDDFPYIINIDANCITDYTISIKDLTADSCEVSEHLGIQCCELDCSNETTVVNLQCSIDQTIIATVDFNFLGSDPDSVDIYTNDEFISTMLATPNHNRIIELPSLTVSQSLIICEHETMCCDTVFINNPCLCNIFDIHTSVFDCNDENESYFLRIDFETSTLVSDSFTIGKPGNFLGTHAYKDLPLGVGPIMFDENDGDLFIVDQNNAVCFDFIFHETLDSCDAITCEFSDLSVIPDIDCELSETNNYTIAFNTSVESDGFQIIIDGVSYGLFSYGEDTYYIADVPTAGLTSSTIEIVDNQSSDCRISDTITPLTCTCSYDSLQVIQVCDNDSLIAIQLDFTPMGQIDDSFTITMDDTATNYDYSQLPLTLTDVASEDIYFTISDANNPNCTTTVEQDLVCPLACEITNFEVELVSCEEIDIANFSFTFDDANLSTDSIILTYNGLIIDSFLVQNSSIYQIPLLDLDCELDFNLFTIQAINDSDCKADFSMPNIDCCTPCEINNVEVSATCFDDMSVQIAIDFDYSGQLSDSLELTFLNHDSVKISIDQVPYIIELTAFTPGIYSLDLSNDFCSFSDTLSVLCTEPCFIQNIRLDTLSCVDGFFSGLLDFDHISIQDSFRLLTNEINIGNYAFDDLPIEVGPYEANESDAYIFTITVPEQANCLGIYNLGNIDCTLDAVHNSIFNDIRWSTLASGVMIEGLTNCIHLSLIDLTGRTLFNQNIQQDQVYIQNEGLMQGLYFVKLQDQKGRIHTIKIIL